jgi:hypothetical protein
MCWFQGVGVTIVIARGFVADVASFAGYKKQVAKTTPKAHIDPIISGFTRAPVLEGQIVLRP